MGKKSIKTVTLVTAFSHLCEAAFSVVPVSLAMQSIYINCATVMRPFHYDVILFHAHQMNRMIAMINQ